jgi:hypothetical protein
MIRVEVVGEGHMKYWDDRVPEKHLVVNVKLEEDGPWMAHVACNVAFRSDPITDILVPLLQEVVKVTRALNGLPEDA